MDPAVTPPLQLTFAEVPAEFIGALEVLMSWFLWLLWHGQQVHWILYYSLLCEYYCYCIIIL